MMFMILLVVVFGIFLSTNEKFIVSSQNIRPRKYTSRCGSVLELTDCDLSEIITLSRRETNKFKARYTASKQCTFKQTTFDWTLLLHNGTQSTFPNYRGRETFVLKPYSSGSGVHSIMVFVTEVQTNGRSEEMSEACAFEIIPEDPVAIIVGGHDRIVNANQNFEVDGGNSIDMESPPGSRGNLQYKWSCRSSGGIGDEFCAANLGTKPSVSVPSKYAPVGQSYDFTLHVKTADSNWVKATQEITTEVNAIVMRVNCLKNCPPIVLKTNREEDVMLKAECLENCAGVKADEYFWTIDNNFEFDKNFENGKTKGSIILKANSLESGTKYTISVNYSNKKRASIVLDVYTPNKLKSCTITPTSGQALKTKFVVNCDYNKGQYMFEIYSVFEHKEVLVSKGARLKDMRFTLGPDSKVKVKMIDRYYFSDSMDLDVAVSGISATATDDVRADIDNTFFQGDDSIMDMMHKGRYDEAVQAMDGMSDILEKVGKHHPDVAKEYNEIILNTLQHIPLDMSVEGRQLAAIAKKIGDKYRDKPDPTLAKLVTDICAKSAKDNSESLQKNPSAENLAGDVKKDAKMYAECSQAGAKSHKEILQADENITTTAFPEYNAPVITENYPDYVDDQNISKILKNFATTTQNMINLCYDSSSSLLATMVPNENTKSVHSKHFKVTATKVNGSEVSQTTVTSHNVNLTLSEDLEAYTNVSVLMCISKDNPFWWNNKVQTSIAYLQFKADAKNLTEFKNPYYIHFKIEKNFTDHLEVLNGTTPESFKKTGVPSGDDFEKMTVYRIEVVGNQSYLVEFVNLEENALNVYISHFEKSPWEVFEQNCQTVTKNSSKIIVNNSLPYDSWDYLHIYPSKQENDTKIAFEFMVYSYSCYQWDGYNRKWTYACTALRDDKMEKIRNKYYELVETGKVETERIKCTCYHSAILTGNVTNSVIRKEKTLITEFELEIQASSIILISVAVVYLIYCVILSIMSFFRKVPDKKVYFLSDVPDTFKYGYLAIVRTGNKQDASTTSNVFLKIYGSKSTSEKHILNYPDPEQRILQKNQEDWLFLATKQHLGDVEKIEIWFDSVGVKPNWYCSDVEIVDLQEKKYWKFNVKFKFEIGNQESYFYTVVPEKSMNKKQIFLKTMSNPFQGSHMLNLTASEAEYSNVYRLNLILSIFLTTFLTTLFLYGFPNLTNSDVLDQFLSYSINAKVVLSTIISAVIAFGLHYPLIYCYRKYHKRSLSLGKLLQMTVPELCWCILTCLVLLSMTILIIFGFWLPYISSLMWLTSATASILVYLFIFENIARLVRNFLSMGKARASLIMEKVQSLMSYVELQRRVLYQRFGSGILRPYLSDVYELIDRNEVKEKQYQFSIKQQVLEVLEDLAMVTVYVVLLYLVIIYDRDPMIYKSHNEVQELVKGIHSRTIPIHEIGSRKEILDYLTDTFIFSMQSPHWYAKYVYYNPGMTIDNNNKYIGIGRLRQHRSDNISCTVDKLVDFLNVTCRPEYAVGAEYRNFSESWGINSESNNFARLDNVWKYTSALKAGTLPYTGKFGIYPGGGYICPLGRTMKNSLTNAKYISRTGWIDYMTRCIFVEILLYSPNSNLFNSIYVKFEISAAGYIRSIYNVQTARLLFIKEETSALLWLILISFVIVVTIFITKIVYKVIRHKKFYFKDLMHLLDLLIILLSVACFFLYLERSYLVDAFLKQIEAAKRNDFVNYFHLFYAETTFTLLAALLVFVATFRLWKLLKFFVIIRIVEKTLILSTAPLLCVFLWQLLMVTCYAVAGMLLFGDQAYHFRDVRDTLITLLLMSLGLSNDFDFDILSESLHIIYYSSYMICSMLIYNFYITIITISYDDAQLYYSNMEEYTVFEYLKEQGWYYWNYMQIRVKNLRLSGGEDFQEQKKVYPKAAEHRYADCLTTNTKTMKSMTFISLQTLRSFKQHRWDQTDFNLVKRTIVNFLMKGDGPKEIFFITNLRGFHKRIMDNRVFLKMEKIASFLLQKDEGRHENLYKKVVEAQNKRMDKISDNLSVLSNIIQQINLDE